MRLRKGLPEISVAMSGNYVESRDKVELKNLTSRIGETEISGWASMARNGKRHLEADLASPRLDLTRFLEEGGGQQGEDESAGGAERHGRETACERAEEEEVRLQRDALGARRAQACRCEAAFRRHEVKLAAGSAEGRRWHADRRRRSTAVRGTREGRHRGHPQRRGQTDIDGRRSRRPRAQSRHQEPARRPRRRRRD